MAMRKNKNALPPPYVELTKDARYEGTFEVLVPAPDRVRPHRVPQQFPTKESAESWLHSPEGVETIRDMLTPGKQRA
jgi:hypothetical protein